MEGNSTYSQIELTNSSVPDKKLFLIRFIISLVIMGSCCFVLFAIGIVEVVGIIFLPRQDPYFALTNLQLNTFQLTNFCPSMNDTSCCINNVCNFTFTANYNLTMEVSEK